MDPYYNNNQNQGGFPYPSQEQQPTFGQNQSGFNTGFQTPYPPPPHDQFQSPYPPGPQTHYHSDQMPQAPYPTQSGYQQQPNASSGQNYASMVGSLANHLMKPKSSHPKDGSHGNAKMDMAMGLANQFLNKQSHYPEGSTSQSQGPGCSQGGGNPAEMAKDLMNQVTGKSQSSGGHGHHGQHGGGFSTSDVFNVVSKSGGSKSGMAKAMASEFMKKQ